MNKSSLFFAVVLLGAAFPVLVSPSCIRVGPSTEPFSLYLERLESVPELRVRIVRKDPSCTVAVHGPYTIENADGGAIGGGNTLPNSACVPSGGGMRLGDRAFPYDEVRIIPADLFRGDLEVNGRRYRGSLRLRVEEGTLSAINVVDCESYLAGVIGPEMPVRDSRPAALEAHCIAARTYALYQARIRAGGSFDLAADTADQMYTGMDTELRDPGAGRRIRETVQATQGRVLTWHEKLVKAYYHSTCGGGTDSVERVYDEREIPPFSGVPCDFCRISPRYRWEATIPRERIERILELRGIREIEPLEPDPFGRCREVRIHHADGRATLRSRPFRERVGLSTLYSAKFSVRREGNAFHFEGGGWGHGVGLCQFGAIGMGREGHDATAILAHYYPGAVLRAAY